MEQLTREDRQGKKCNNRERKLHFHFFCETAREWDRKFQQQGIGQNDFIPSNQSDILVSKLFQLFDGIRFGIEKSIGFVIEQIW